MISPRTLGGFGTERTAGTASSSAEDRIPTYGRFYPSAGRVSNGHRASASRHRRAGHDRCPDCRNVRVRPRVDIHGSPCTANRVAAVGKSRCAPLGRRAPLAVRAGEAGWSTPSFGGSRPRAALANCTWVKPRRRSMIRRCVERSCTYAAEFGAFKSRMLGQDRTRRGPKCGMSQTRWPLLSHPSLRRLHAAVGWRQRFARNGCHMAREGLRCLLSANSTFALV